MHRLTITFVLISQWLASVAGTTDPQSAYKPTTLDEYTSYCALWRTDANYHSAIRLTNQLATSAIAVNVTLYMADGTAYRLPTQVVPASGVSVIDVNGALSNAPARLRGQLSTYGSASVSYRHDWKGVVYASMSILDAQRSLEHVYGFALAPPAAPSADKDVEIGTSAREGLWWRTSATAGGFIALANTLAKDVDVTVTLSGLKHPTEKVHPLGPHRTVLLDLTDLIGDDGARVGGIQLAHTAPQGAVQAVGGLEDVATGYSADIPFADASTKAGPVGARRYAAPGIMVNDQDPLLGFPSRMAFSPYVYLRNVASEPRTIGIDLYYTVGKNAEALPVPPQLRRLVLMPGEARELPTAEILRNEHAPHSIDLAFSYEGRYGDIIIACGSVDAARNYVFSVTPQAVSKSAAKNSPYWLFGNGWDTMYTIWNPDTFSQDFLVTLRYAEKESYRIPMRLEPQASAMIDIGELVRARLPDQDGKVLPLDIRHGMLLVTAPSGTFHEAVNLVLTGGIYNPRKGTCGATCQNCYGLIGSRVEPPTLSVGVGESAQLDLLYTYSGGTDYSLTDNAAWNTANQSIATVQTTGANIPGMVTGAGKGSTTISGSYFGEFAQNTYQVCGDPAPPPCPTYNTQVGGNSSVEVTSCGNPDINGLYDEYRNSSYGTAYRPECTTFRTNVTTTHFSFYELNVSNTYTYGIFTSALTDGVECIRSENGGTPLTINSAYRGPARNQQVGGAPDSRHIYGDGVDFSAPSGSHLRTYSSDIKTACGACREPLQYTSSWVHFDWRGGCPTGW